MEDATFVAFKAVALLAKWQPTTGEGTTTTQETADVIRKTMDMRMHGKHLTYNKVEQQGTNLALLFLSNFWIMLECWIHAGRGILAECCGLVESPPIQVVEWAEEERIYRICIAETCPCITCYFY